MRTELAEVDILAADLARAYGRMVSSYRTGMQMTADEAHAQATTPRLDALDEPADQVSWIGWSSLAEHDPEASYALWQRIKQEARAELDSGHRAAKAMEWSEGSPWQRAQFLVIRDSFIEEWQPTGGIERALIDTMAQCYAGQVQWMEVLTYRSEREAAREQTDITATARWTPPRVDHQLATDNAAAMVEKCNRLFLWTLRSLRDLRRYTLVINNPGQVNIGAQQVNTTTPHD